MGTQSDIDSTSTTCYLQVNETYAFIDKIVDGGYTALGSLVSGNFSQISSQVQQMVQYVNNLAIQMSDQILACQDAVKIKQLSTRTNKLSGLANWVFTIAYGIGFDYVKD
jgi:hypothetical protein